MLHMKEYQEVGKVQHESVDRKLQQFIEVFSKSEQQVIHIINIKHNITMPSATLYHDNNTWDLPIALKPLKQ